MEIDHDLPVEKKQPLIMSEGNRLPFGLTSRPPFHLLLFLALQQCLSSISGPLAATYIIHSSLCAEGDNVFFAELLSTNLFLSGICTMLQTIIGVRLPLVQGTSYSFIPPLVAMMASERWKCPSSSSPPNVTSSVVSTTVQPMESVDKQHLWKPRIMEVNGALVVASVVQMLLGMLGVMGFLIRFIGPLTITPTIALISLTIYKGALRGMQHHWGVGFTTVGTVILCSIVLGRLQVPIPVCSREKGCHTSKFPIFRLLPTLLGICLGWLLAHILTVTNTLPSDPSIPGFRARTDAKLDVLYKTKWFVFPYPGRWGGLTLSFGVIMGMIAAMLASVIESIGDYYACAKICEAPNPPKHAVNRGIFIEGLGNTIGGVIGATAGTNTYSGPIGMIGITGVASRSVFILSAVLLAILGVFGKVGAALTIIPDPVMGALTTVGLGVVLSVALANLQYVDMRSPRNSVILGVSIMLGLMIPEWIGSNKKAINTGNAEADSVLTVLLSTAMFVGGFTGFVLDNLLPGSSEERGMKAFQHNLAVETNASESNESDETISNSSIYGLPFKLDSLFNRFSLFTYCPCLPSYVDRNISCCKCKKITSYIHSFRRDRNTFELKKSSR